MAAVNMRKEMPIVAAWVDELRAAFGANQIDPSIRAGMKGGTCFYASEAGHVLGQQDSRPCIAVGDMVLAPTGQEYSAANSLKNARRGK